MLHVPRGVKYPLIQQERISIRVGSLGTNRIVRILEQPSRIQWIDTGPIFFRYVDASRFVAFADVLHDGLKVCFFFFFFFLPCVSLLAVVGVGGRGYENL